jgi:hypothetical protein
VMRAGLGPQTVWMEDKWVRLDEGSRLPGKGLDREDREMELETL